MAGKRCGDYKLINRMMLDSYTIAGILKCPVPELTSLGGGSNRRMRTGTNNFKDWDSCSFLQLSQLFLLLLMSPAFTIG